MTIKPKSGKPQKVKLSLWMLSEEKKKIENRKYDRDISTTLFLMRIIRKHFLEVQQEQEEQEQEQGGVRSSPRWIDETPASSAAPIPEARSKRSTTITTTIVPSINSSSRGGLGS